MIHSGWITNSRSLRPRWQTCLVRFGNLSFPWSSRGTWVIGTTMRFGARQSGAISNSVRSGARGIRRPVVFFDVCRFFQVTFLLWMVPGFATSESFVDTLATTAGLGGSEVFSWFGEVFWEGFWLAMERNNFMTAFFSENGTDTIQIYLIWLITETGVWLITWELKKVNRPTRRFNNCRSSATKRSSSNGYTISVFWCQK